MNLKRAKSIRRLLLPSQQIDGKRVSSGTLFRATTAYDAVQVPKSTLNMRRQRFGRTPAGERVMATIAIQGRLKADTPRAAYKRIKGGLA